MPSHSLASPMPPRGAVVGGLLALAAVCMYFQLIWTASVEAPFLDDYDAVLGFLTQWLDAEGGRARWRLIFRPHNEHVLGLPHAWVVLSHRLAGRLDIRLLNLIGNGYLLLLVAALFAAFRRDAAPAVRIGAFAPAVPFLLQPQHWTALLSPTVSLSNAGVVALAALAFAALEWKPRIAGGIAAAAALGASLSQANGFLVWPVALVVLLLHGRRHAALLWGVAAVAALAILLGGLGPTPLRTSPLAALDRPDRIIAYSLNFLGCAVGFSHPGASLAAGAALLASVVALSWQGLPRRSPALFALLLFLLASVAANALLRSHQGAGAPLLQPRYAFYSAVLLAINYLGWAELLSGRRAGRRWQAGMLAASVVFCLASHAVSRGKVMDLSARLSNGLERWWSTGDGGLIHPDFRKASFFMLKGLDQGLFQIPREWVDRYAAAPEQREPPPASTMVRHHLHTLRQDKDLLIVSGWAVAGSSALHQEVEVVLATPRGVLFYPALEVLRIDLPKHSEHLASLLAPSGFRALISTADLEDGEYRLGILVRKGQTEHLTWRHQPITIAGTTP